MQTLLTEQAQQSALVFNQQMGMNQLPGVHPCIFDRARDHPLPTAEGRRFARFRRRIEAGIRYQRGRGRTVYFLTLAMRYDRGTGRLKGNLRYSTQRFVQMLRRSGRSVEYLRVIESTAEGVKNHAHLVLAVDGEMPSDHAVKSMWARATYGSSFEAKAIRASPDVGQLTRYLSKALGSYLSKSFPDAEGVGLDRSDRSATVRDHVSTSRGWMPDGAEAKWKELFRENAFIWLCDRGFYHTDLGETSVKWLRWVDSRARRPDPGLMIRLSC